MRILVAALLLAASGPALSQGVAVATQSSVDAIGRRVGTLESQMRAVQRQVFPGGDKRFFPPEAPPATEAAAPEAAPAGTPATNLLTDLTQRVDTLERQQKALTGQIEELQFKQRQLEQALAKFRGDTEFRLDAIEKGGASSPAPAPASAPSAAVSPPAAVPPSSPVAKPSSAAAKPATTSPAAVPANAEEAYRSAMRQWTSKNYPAAQQEMEAFVKAYPKDQRASNAQFWAGRALMEQGQPAQAAKSFLAGYQAYPRGERAPNSLLWLGKALVAMKQPKAACQALDQLATAYPDKLTGQLKTDSDAARKQANCQ